MPARTNALRLIAAARLVHEVRAYELDIDAFTAEAVASLIGLPIGQVFKTLVARGERTGPCFAVVPGGTQVDLKALAATAGERRMALVPSADVEPLTGYRRGAVTAIASRKDLPVYLDASAEELERIAVSAGTRGLQVLLRTEDYVALTGAIVSPIARPTHDRRHEREKR